MLQATLEHATKSSSNSAVKKSAIEFVARLILVSPPHNLPPPLLSNIRILKLDTEHQYQGAFKAGRTAEEIEKFEEWILHLPKVLWELGSNNLFTTEVVLRFILRISQRKSHLAHPEVSPTPLYTAFPIPHK